MRFALLTIVLSYILMVQAALLPDFPSRVIPTTRMANLELHPFQISHFYSNSYKESGQSWNRTLTFLFTDPNANTSTICSASWTQTTRVTTPPTSYHSCYYNGNDEVFQWSFTAFKSLAQFSLVFRHAFKYPEEFLPPFEWVGMSSSQNNFNLTCFETGPGGLQGCVLPTRVYCAGINAVTN